MKTLIVVTLALVAASPAAAAASLPLRDPAGLASTWQQHVNRLWDPAGRCRVVTSYSVRCVFTDSSGSRVQETFSKAGAHRVRTLISVGGVGPVVRYALLKPSSLLYRYV